jgi:hypothetical protein
VTFVQQATIVGIQFVHSNHDAAAERWHGRHGVANLGQDPQPLTLARSTRERVTLDVPRQAHARAQDHVRLVA